MKETAYLLQSTLIALWWIGLASSSRFFAAFQFEGISATAFWAFFAPDIILIGGLSAVRACRKNAIIEYVILGAFGYASLYCCNATALTNSGWLATSLMLLGLAYNGFLCFNASLFRASSSGLFGNAVKTLVQILCVWSITLIVFPLIILQAFGAARIPELGFASITGILLFACSSFLGLSSAVFMVKDGSGTPLPVDQTNRLVVSGPYRYLRNPMAVAGIGQGIALAITWQSFPLFAYALSGAVVWQFVVRPIEEQNLVTRFGEPYEAYRVQTPCWIPRFAQKS